MDPTSVALLVAGIGVFGPLAGVVVAEILARSREKAAENRRRTDAVQDRVVSWHRETLHLTRGLVRATLAGMEATARADLPAILVAQTDMRRFEGGNIRLVGDEQAIRDYQSLIADLRQLVGRTIPAGYPVRSAKVLGAVLNALDQQEERLLRGEPLHKVDPAVAPDLFGPESLAARMDLFAVPPSVQGIVVRKWIDLLRWWQARGEHEQPQASEREPGPDG
jgi:hypothetical protein